MSDYDVVFPRVKVLEGLLESRWGATGRGLHEKLSSVESRIDSKIISRGRFIASVRNKVAHEDGYQLDDVSGFIQACEQVERYLRTAPTSAARASAAAAASRPQASTPAPPRPSSSAQASYADPTLLEIWRGSYVILVWLSVALYYFFLKTRFALSPAPVYLGLIMTIAAGMKTFVSENDDAPNLLAYAFLLPVAFFMAFTVGNKIGGISGGLLIFFVTLVLGYVLQLLFISLRLTTVVWAVSWVSRGLYKIVTYSIALSVVISIVLAVIKLFLAFWKPA